jgi:hypothetical protein
MTISERLEDLRSLLGPLCVAIRGCVGDRVYKTYGEKIIVTRVPCFAGYLPSAAQRDRRDRMRAATAFAQAVYADPAAKAVYVAAAKALGRQPFRLAVSDFLHGRSRITPSVPGRLQSQASPADVAQKVHVSRGRRPVHPPPAARSFRGAGTRPDRRDPRPFQPLVSYRGTQQGYLTPVAQIRAPVCCPLCRSRWDHRALLAAEPHPSQAQRREGKPGFAKNSLASRGKISGIPASDL